MKRRRTGLRLLFAAFLLFFVGESLAATASMQLASEGRGRKEILTLKLPDTARPPRLKLLQPTLLKIVLPGVLAVPLPRVESDRIRMGQADFIQDIREEEIREEELGLNLLVSLKEPYLNIQETLQDGIFTLTFSRYPITAAVGPTRLIEARPLAGRDGTLLVISYTGHGWVETSVDFGARVARLTFPEAKFMAGWKVPGPTGMMDGMAAYEFPVRGVEMEVKLHPSAAEVYFHKSPESGTLIVEMLPKSPLEREVEELNAVRLDRGDEARAIIERRRAALLDGYAEPLNRLTPVFVAGEEQIILSETPLTELYFYDKALENIKEFKFARAHAYLDQLLKYFPDSPNRALIEFKLVDLGVLMKRSPGLMLSRLEGVLARYPNWVEYPKYRLMMLKLLNQANQFINAQSMMGDPNLPKSSAEVELERAKTEIGMREYDQAEKYLKRVYPLDPINGQPSATAYFLEAKVKDLRGDGDGAVKILDDISRVHAAILANKSENLMLMGDLYFKNKQYSKALHQYALLLTNYPVDPVWASWAMVKAGECRRYLGEMRDAVHLYKQVIAKYPESETALWARIYLNQLDKDRGVDERLKDLNAIIKITPLNRAIVEAHLEKAVLLGKDKRYRQAIGALNHLLTLISRETLVGKSNKLKHQFLDDGMTKELEDGNPERAVLLAELYGVDWRDEPDFALARIRLAEALLRMGMPEQALPLLKGLKEPVTARLVELGKAMTMGTPMGVPKKKDGTPDVYEEGGRVRLDEAKRLARRKEWEGVLVLLEEFPPTFLGDKGKQDRLRLLAMAEAGRGRFPQAVGNLERLLFSKPVGDGLEHFWYANLVEMWKGRLKAKGAFETVAEKAENKEVQSIARMRLGEIAQIAGGDGWKKAQKEYEEAARLAPSTMWAEASEEIARQLGMGK